MAEYQSLQKRAKVRRKEFRASHRIGIGSDAMIFKFFRQKNGEKWAFLCTHNKAKLCKYLIMVLFFSQKITENCDHNIEPLN
jgi:hypothetical protein